MMTIINLKGNAGVPLSQPVYRYIKNPEDSRFWVIDPEVADVVRRIYDMALEGFGSAAVDALAPPVVGGIDDPILAQGVCDFSQSIPFLESTKWGHTTIKKILTLQEYCGDIPR